MESTKARIRAKEEDRAAVRVGCERDIALRTYGPHPVSAALDRPNPPPLGEGDREAVEGASRARLVRVLPPPSAPLRYASTSPNGGGFARAILPNHPNSPEFPQRIQRRSRLRRRELALIEDGRTISPGSVAWEGRKALRACCGGSGWSGSSGSVCQGPLPREPSDTGVAWACGETQGVWLKQRDAARRAVAHQ